MDQAQFRFYADLNDFLSYEYQQQAFAYPVPALTPPYRFILEHHPTASFSISIWVS